VAPAVAEDVVQHAGILAVLAARLAVSGTDRRDDHEAAPRPVAHEAARVGQRGLAAIGRAAVRIHHDRKGRFAGRHVDAGDEALARGRTRAVERNAHDLRREPGHGGRGRRKGSGPQQRERDRGHAKA
jgi:hypothetical protein